MSPVAQLVVQLAAQLKGMSDFFYTSYHAEF